MIYFNCSLVRKEKMVLNNEELLSIKGGMSLLKDLNSAFSRVVRAFKIRYLMHILFVN